MLHPYTKSHMASLNALPDIAFKSDAKYHFRQAAMLFLTFCKKRAHNFQTPSPHKIS